MRVVPFITPRVVKKIKPQRYCLRCSDEAIRPIFTDIASNGKIWIEKTQKCGLPASNQLIFLCEMHADKSKSPQSERWRPYIQVQ